MATLKNASKAAVPKQAKKLIEVKSLETLKKDLAAKRQDMIDSRRSHRAADDGQHQRYGLYIL